ncbi:MAG: 4-hydroxy-tetrahydrodipicolinate synthase [Acidimicrobiia bacterium]|nr:4-hydroxy-tetrahydrodipicolinate synthase [Acidimicrobiia bacterium]
MEGTFGDVVTAMITPFGEDLSLDVDGAARLARALLESGSDAVLASGTTGESPTLSFDEKAELFRAVVDAAAGAGAGKVLAGTSSYDTAASVRLTTAATEIGVDGILAVTPYYNRPPQRGLEIHFRAIADATDLPVILYDIPGRTGCGIELDTYERLAAHPRIIGVKDATGSSVHVGSVRAVCGDAFEVYSGDDAQTLPFLSVGARGVISVASHVAGVQISEMIRAYKAGDVESARKTHDDLLPLFRILFEDSSPIPVKAACEMLGLPAGPPRPPLAPIEPDLATRLQAVVSRYRGVS